jgi:hypothetical protein
MSRERVKKFLWSRVAFFVMLLRYSLAIISQLNKYNINSLKFNSTQKRKIYRGNSKVIFLIQTCGTWWLQFLNVYRSKKKKEKIWRFSRKVSNYLQTFNNTENINWKTQRKNKASFVWVKRKNIFMILWACERNFIERLSVLCETRNEMDVKFYNWRILKLLLSEKMSEN